MTNLPPDVAFLASLPAAIDLDGRTCPRTTEGSRMHEPKDVVLAIRRDLKLAVKAGLIPAHAKLSVTREDKSINIALTAWQGQVLVTGYVEVCMEAYIAGEDAPSVEATDPFMTRCGYEHSRRQGHDGRLIDAINDVMWLVERIADRHNYDRSDSMVDHFDVGYYLEVSARALIAVAERGLKLECDPAARELARKAHEAANRLGPAVVKSICGKRGVDGCNNDWSMEQLVKLDARANGRPLVYNKRLHRWLVDTSKPVADSAAKSASGE